MSNSESVVVSSHPVEVLTIEVRLRSQEHSLRNDDVAYIPVTRFNVKMDAGKNSVSTTLKGRHLPSSPEYDAYWQSRVEIFERVCVPSVVNLSPRPDAWLIAFGDTDPPYIQELIERLQDHEWIHPYVRNPNDPRNARPLNTMLRERTRELGKQFLCTSRLDSDDSLHKLFLVAIARAIAQLRKRGMGDDKCCLCFPYGLAEEAGQLSVYMRGTNMFQSVYAPMDAIQGPYPTDHDRIREAMPLREVIANLPMWMYHRHENTTDSPHSLVRDRLPVPTDSGLLADFGLTPASLRMPKSIEPNDPKHKAPPSSTPLADELRSARNWSESQVTSAIELAVSLGLPEVALWLTDGDALDVDVREVLGEMEQGGSWFLDASHWIALGTQLQDQGFTRQALRAYDYAVQSNPRNVQARATRKALAGSLFMTLDRAEQGELTAIGAGEPSPGTALVIIASASSLETDPAAIDRVHGLGLEAMARGRTACVLLIADRPVEEDVTGAVEALDGITYEWLPGTRSTDIDVLRRMAVRQAGERALDVNPGTISTDGTELAMAVAAALGRAFGAVVDFGAGQAALPG